jgi:hypothetical protein
MMLLPLHLSHVTLLLCVFVFSFPYVSALLCIQSPSQRDLPLPPECSDSAAHPTLALNLDTTWPSSLSITAFIATLECAFNGSLPDIASPFAFASAPRFTLGSAVLSKRLASRSLALGRIDMIKSLLGTRTPKTSTLLRSRWRIGIVPLLFISNPFPRGSTWQPLDRKCAVHRARHPQRHATLCAMSSGAQPSTPFLTTAEHVDCDWAVAYYGSTEEHALPLERLRFFFHMPRSLKSDLLVAVAGVASTYTTVLYMDEDIVIRFNSTVWETELRCVFGHVPVVWRPTFRPHAQSIWPWMNADCFDDSVRALAIGNFSFLEPQIAFMRAKFFTYFVDQYVVPVFAQFPDIRSIWTLFSTICFLAERSFPHAVPCAMTRTLTVEHADLRTLSKGETHLYNSQRITMIGMRHFPENDQLGADLFEFVKSDAPCVSMQTIGVDRFEPWIRPPQSASSRIGMHVISQRQHAVEKLRQSCV